MVYRFEPFCQDHIDSALDIFLKNYAEEQKESKLLPAALLENPEPIKNRLRQHADNTGIVVFKKNIMIAYLITGSIFNFKNQKAALIPEFGHACIINDKKNIYYQMYMHISTIWIKQKIHLHLIGHFAHDTILKETLYQLGFGAFLAERLRNFSHVENLIDAVIKYEQDPEKLVDIALEHNQYYPDSPIFIKKSIDRQNILNNLKQHIANNDQFLVYYENNFPMGYFIIGDSAKQGEGFLLKNTNTAQIKSAFIKPEIRGKGIGKRLLQESITWSKRKGFSRLFVEHETANYYGGNFWRKHFKPYLNFSLRYIDNSI